ncbi:MAG TPA: hydrolase [Solirubrobacterales bacterium]|jgi:nicotinamidase-related amidase|nr:hydrolase [Solirubrobacterales bacterium]
MSGKLDAKRAALVVVDVQEGFRPAIPGFDRIAAATATMVRGAAAMDVPIVVTEQYPKGLGPTVPEVAEHLPDGVEPLAKTVFSAASADGFALGGREQAIVCGIEAHVCVNQTVLELLDGGLEVHVVTDAVGSRSPADRELGIAKAERAGAWPTSVETALFELLGKAGDDRFKQVQGLVLEYAP